MKVKKINGYTICDDEARARIAKVEDKLNDEIVPHVNAVGNNTVILMNSVNKQAETLSEHEKEIKATGETAQEAKDAILNHQATANVRISALETKVNNLEMGGTGNPSESFEELVERLEIVEASAASISESVESLGSDVNGLGVDVDSLTTRVENLENSAPSGGTDGDTTGLTNRVTTLETRANETDESLIDMDTRVSSLESRANTFNISINALNSSVSTLKTRADGFDSSIATITGDVSSLKSRADGFSTAISDLTDDVESIGARVTNLEQNGGTGGGTGANGKDGEDGGYYTPSIDESGVLTWAASKDTMTAAASVNLVSIVLNNMPTWEGGSF